MSFSQLRSQLLQLEKQTESQLAHLSPASTEADAQKVQSLLDKRSGLLQQLESLGDQKKSVVLDRHREVLGEHMRSFSQLQARYAEERMRTDLLASVQSDISQHRQREQSGNDYILDERVRVDSANNFAEDLLQRALNTRDELWQQRERLGGAQLRVMGAIQSIPGLNVVIQKINTRRRRDTVILASVIAFCIIVLFFV